MTKMAETAKMANFAKTNKIPKVPILTETTKMPKIPKTANTAKMPKSLCLYTSIPLSLSVSPFCSLFLIHFAFLVNPQYSIN